MLKWEEKNVMPVMEKGGTELIRLNVNLMKKATYAIHVIIAMAEALNQLKTIDGFAQDVKQNLE